MAEIWWTRQQAYCLAVWALTVVYWPRLIYLPRGSIKSWTSLRIERQVKYDLPGCTFFPLLILIIRYIFIATVKWSVQLVASGTIITKAFRPIPHSFHLRGRHRACPIPPRLCRTCPMLAVYLRDQAAVFNNCDVVPHDFAPCEEAACRQELNGAIHAVDRVWYWIVLRVEYCRYVCDWCGQEASKATKGFERTKNGGLVHEKVPLARFPKFRKRKSVLTHFVMLLLTIGIR